MANVQDNIQSIFSEALSIETEAERIAYLDQACGSDPEKRREVERLLNANDRAGNFLPNAEPGDEPTIDEVGLERVGAQVGPYKLLELLGEGAFGSVYMAEQREPVRRKVALKVLKPGMDTKSLIARFDAEKQALAMMDHPNIARVFDAGATPSGRPYFVMELVKGLPITKYADQKNLTMDERLEIFVSVCHAVQHAHQKGIIHRDIKPSNVMVARHDDQAVVKVIDFGIAKALHQPLTEQTLFTGFGQIVGTVLYMSPEQAELNALDVDTRSDVYSLGVLLYELLTGVTPHDRRRLLDAAFDEMRNIIRNEEPQRPSTRVSTLGDSAIEICEHRKTEPKRLSALMSGDLDWIVMKTLEKDRARRYDTAKDLASDIVHYLNHEPVKASPPSVTYRARKFIQRNQGVVGMAAACLLLVTLLCGNLWHNSVTNARARAAELQAEIDRRERIEQSELAAESRRREEESNRIAQDLKWRNDSVADVKLSLTKFAWHDAFILARELKERFPEDEEVEQYLDQASFVLSVDADQEGSSVSIRQYDEKDADWETLGQTPIHRRLAKGVYRWRVIADGLNRLEGIAGPEDVRIDAVLTDSGQADPGMVRVSAVSETGQPIAFLVDRFEIRNREFADFVAQGGYHNKAYWKHPFRARDRVLSFEQAIASFQDSTGKLGPATWGNGTYPPGEEDLPVTGICWYEAAAYAEWAGKQLPTLWQWRTAASLDQAAVITPLSNFDGDGPAEVGQYRGISKFGAYDMAGNVAEWCVNSSSDGRKCVLGGAFNTTSYMFGYQAMYPPFERLPNVGFRCAKTYQQSGLDVPDIVGVPPQDAFVNVPPPPSQDELNQLLTQYEYSSGLPLNDSVVDREQPESFYRHETIQVDPAYGGPPLLLHLLLPESGKKPHRTVVYFPGIGAKALTRFSDNRDLIDRQYPLGLVMRGWAVCWPEYRGTFSRATGPQTAKAPQTVELVTQQVLDLRRAVDYLETRSDLNTSDLVYYGLSWGANIGSLMTVAEPRFSAAVFVAGALWTGNVAEPAKYVAHVSIPVLMINTPEDNAANTRALFDHLGTVDKTQKYAGSFHLPPVEFTSETTALWLSDQIGHQEAGQAVPVDFARQQMKTGELQFRRNRLAQAEHCFHRAWECYKTELGPHHADTLRARQRMLEASLNQAFSPQAISSLDEVLAQQIEIAGPESEDAQKTRSTIVDRCEFRAWDLCLLPSASRELRQEARACAMHARESARGRPLHGLVAFAHFRLGEEQAALAELRQSFATKPDFLFGEWLLAAMVHHKQGSTQAGRDWYRVTSERIRKLKPKWKMIHQLHNEAASLLELPVNWPPEPWDIEANLQAHSRLLEQCPNSAQLHQQRGSHYGRKADWEHALSDYRKAIELDASAHRSWEAATVVSLFFKDTERENEAIDAFLQHGQLTPNANSKLDTVLACCLVKQTPERLEQIEALARAATAKIEMRPFVSLAKGTLLYRQERYGEALELFPADGFTNPKDAILALLYRAMTHHQLGDVYSCRRLLNQARERIEQELPTPGGELLPYQDRPVVWCMAQIVLQEAESLIGAESL